MTIDKKSYLDELVGKLLAWEREINQISGRGEESSGSLRENLSDIVRELKFRREKIKNLLQHLEQADDRSWEELTSRIEELEERLAGSIEGVKKSLGIE